MSGTDSTSPRITRAARPRSAAARRWRAAGYALGVGFCLTFMALGVVLGHLYWGGGAAFRRDFRHVMGAMLVGAAHGNPMENWTWQKQFPAATSMNVLVLGVDHDYDNRAQIIKTTPGRSDSILIAHVDFVGRRISALTIPRDTAVSIPGRRGIYKVNAAHSFGGPDLLVQTIQSVFGITADAWVSVNFEGFQKIVDALGGVDINVEKRLKYDDNWGRLHVNLYPGYQHLNGYQAMGYVRMRHSDSDLKRSERQHQFLEAVRVKLKQPSTFLALPRVVDALNDSFKTGAMTRDQMYALANFARSLPKENIAVETLPSFEGPSFVTVDTDKAAEAIQRLFYPNQVMASTIDAPDPYSVRALNNRYERGGGRRRHRRRSESSEARRERTEPATELSVEESPKEEAPPAEAPGPMPAGPAPADPAPAGGVTGGDLSVEGNGSGG